MLLVGCGCDEDVHVRSGSTCRRASDTQRGGVYALNLREERVLMCVEQQAQVRVIDRKQVVNVAPSEHECMEDVSGRLVQRCLLWKSVDDAGKVPQKSQLIHGEKEVGKMGSTASPHWGALYLLLQHPPKSHIHVVQEK